MHNSWQNLKSIKHASNESQLSVDKPKLDDSSNKCVLYWFGFMNHMNWHHQQLLVEHDSQKTMVLDQHCVNWSCIGPIATPLHEIATYWSPITGATTKATMILGENPKHVQFNIDFVVFKKIIFDITCSCTWVWTCIWDRTQWHTKLKVCLIVWNCKNNVYI